METRICSEGPETLGDKVLKQGCDVRCGDMDMTWKASKAENGCVLVTRREDDG